MRFFDTPVGTKRHRRVFLLFSKTWGNETRWLEMATLLEEYTEVWSVGRGTRNRWMFRGFVDKE